MFERVIGDWRSVAVSEIRLIGIAAAALLAAAAAFGLLCAALFVFVMDRYDVLDACLAVAAVFFVLTLALFILYVASRRQAGREAMAARAARRSLLADPFVVSTGVQIIQAVGIKRVAALLAVAGTAMILASKPAARVRRDAPADR
jgi:hypothetical protein